MFATLSANNSYHKPALGHTVIVEIYVCTQQTLKLVARDSNLFQCSQIGRTGKMHQQSSLFCLSVSNLTHSQPQPNSTARTICMLGLSIIKAKVTVLKDREVKHQQLRLWKQSNSSISEKYQCNIRLPEIKTHAVNWYYVMEGNTCPKYIPRHLFCFVTHTII